MAADVAATGGYDKLESWLRERMGAPHSSHFAATSRPDLSLLLPLPANFLHSWVVAIAVLGAGASARPLVAGMTLDAPREYTSRDL